MTDPLLERHRDEMAQAAEDGADNIERLQLLNRQYGELVERVERAERENAQVARVVHAARVYQLERASGNRTAYRDAYLKLDAALVDLYHGADPVPDAIVVQQREGEGG